MSDSLVTPAGPFDRCSGATSSVATTMVSHIHMNRLQVSSVSLPIRYALILPLVATLSFGATPTRNKRKYHAAVAHKAVAAVTLVTAHSAVVHKASFTPRPVAQQGPVIAGGPWTEPTDRKSTR